MTDYSDITQYGQDTITQILLSQVQYEFLLASAQKCFLHTDRKRHTNTSSGGCSVSKRWQQVFLSQCSGGAGTAGVQASGQKVMWLIWPFLKTFFKPLRKVRSPQGSIPTQPSLWPLSPSPPRVGCPDFAGDGGKRQSVVMTWLTEVRFECIVSIVAFICP